VEIHNATRPAHRPRALIASLLLLVVTTALAGAMAWSRAQHVLGERFHALGWEMSVRVPLHFRRDVVSANAASFHGWTRSGHPTRLIIWRIPLPDQASVSEVVAGVMAKYERAERGGSSASIRTHSEERMGEKKGEQLMDRQMGVIVRAVTSPSIPAFAVTLGVEGHIIDERTYDLFDQVCRSIIFEEAGAGS